MSRPIRLTVVLTHPVQYYSPWFRFIAARCPELALTVVYATEPSAEQQGVGFGRPVTWDVPLREGYESLVVRPVRPGESVSSERFRGLDVREVARAVLDTRPDVALVPGWHSITLLRAIRACRRAGIPLLYRGDTHWGTGPGGWRRLPWRLRTWLLLRCFDGYLAVGRRAREYLVRFGAPGPRIFASPHCVDNEAFAGAAARHRPPAARAAARAALGLAPQAFVVLQVGKFEPRKRPLDVVRAVATLGGGVSLLMVGSGELEEACRAEGRRLNVRVAFAGFLNQSEMGRAYAAADCLVLASASESWGLVVNEALATGLPCVGSDGAGCVPDLVSPGETGEVFAAGDPAALADAIERVRQRTDAGHDWTGACRRRAREHGFEAATAGLLAACRSVATRPPVRAVTCCAGMVMVGGLERMTFEVLRVLRARGAAVHCIVNSWENHRIVALARQIGATWSTGYHWYRFDRHTRNPIRWAQVAWDIARTSLGLLSDARRARATHVLVPEFGSALRNAPALLLLRALGVRVILRAANHPDPGGFYRVVWGWALPPLVDRFVANSQFSAGRLRVAGVPERKLRTIRNAVAARSVPAETDADAVSLARVRPTLLCVGQIAPFKGTHLAVDATVRLLQAGHDVQAVIVGPEPVWPPEYAEYLRAMRQRVAAEGAADRIHFVGERENVPALMRAAYLLVAPIVQEETFGNVALEAKSVGLPVVAFATGGLVELVEHGVTGYLCAEPTLDGLLEGLRYFLDEPARRDKAAAASLAAMGQPESDLQPAEFARRWWALFTEDARS